MEKQVDNTQEQRIAILKKSKLLDFDEAFTSYETASILEAMQEYADLRCKPLAEALQELLETDNLSGSHYWEAHSKAKKALQDYKK